MTEPTNDSITLNAQLDAYAEWFYTDEKRRILALRRNEMAFQFEQDRLYFACWGRDGAQLWRVTDYALGDNGTISLSAARQRGAVTATLGLTPRATVREGRLAVAAARLAVAGRLARLAETHGDGAILDEISLSTGMTAADVGRYARITLHRNDLGIYLLVTAGPVGTPETLLATALLWWAEQIKIAPDAECWLIVNPKEAVGVAERLALLRDEWRERVRLWVYDALGETLQLEPVPQLSDLWEQKIKPLPAVASLAPDEWAAGFAAQYEGQIDCVRGRLGTVLRWHGLPFARVRKVRGVRQVWFGVGGKRQHLLDATTWAMWEKLLADLAEQRTPTPTSKRHKFYRDRSEAWLESLLRQDVTRLDPGLVAAPVHAQLRTVTANAAVRALDLLARRYDGRLAVIEIKTQPDRAQVLQAADYWRRVEQQRRQGLLEKVQLFNTQHLADVPALVYLAAPLLSWHPANEILAGMLSPEIEVFRFDLNEDWRAGVRVARRMKLPSAE